MARRFPVAATLLVAFSHTTFAVTTTEPIVVTATRTAQTVDSVLAPVTVITREDMQARQARSVQDVLRGTPGISLSNTGGSGKTTSVFMRGTESDHVLVLIDGIKVGAATLGTTPFQDLPVEQIERIEIVRGPRSHLYGSEAIGGVIQIFTRRGGGGLTPGVSVGGGSFGTRSGSLSLSGGGGDGWFNLGVSSERTDGFDACSGEPGSAGCFIDEADDDGYRNTSVNVRGGLRLSSGADLDAHWMESDNEAEFDGQFQNESETRQQVAGASLRLTPTESTIVTARLGRSKDLSTNFKDGVFASRFDTERDSATVQGDLMTDSGHVLTAGIDYLDDQVDSDSAFIQTSRDNVGLFTQFQGEFGRREVLFGVRRDDNEQYGGKTTGGVTFGHHLSTGTQLTLSWGNAFKAPSFNELYFPGFGNPDLDPEESESIELGLSGAGNRWSVNVFETDIDDLIGFDPDTFASVNIDSARIRGVELEANTTFAGWNLSGALTLLDPENRASAFEGNILPRRAERSLRLDLDRDFGRYSAGTTLISEGRKFDDLANSRRIDSYATVDLRFSMKLGEDWRALLRVENLFDEEYETASFFNQPERSFYLTFRYVPGG